MKSCPKCGKKYDDSWEICLNCQGALQYIDDDKIPSNANIPTEKDSNNMDFVSSYSMKIVDGSMDNVQAICKLYGDREIAEEKWPSVLYEFIYLYLHLTDRHVFGQVDNTVRNEVMTAIERASISMSIEVMYNGEEADKLFNECMHNIAVRSTEYSKFQKIFPVNDEKSENTVFGEFGKIITETINKKNNSACIKAVSEIITEGFIKLDIASLIDEIT